MSSLETELAQAVINRGRSKTGRRHEKKWTPTPNISIEMHRRQQLTCPHPTSRSRCPLASPNFRAGGCGCRSKTSQHQAPRRAASRFCSGNGAGQMGTWRPGAGWFDGCLLRLRGRSRRTAEKMEYCAAVAPQQSTSFYCSPPVGESTPPPFSAPCTTGALRGDGRCVIHATIYTVKRHPAPVPYHTLLELEAGEMPPETPMHAGLFSL